MNDAIEALRESQRRLSAALDRLEAVIDLARAAAECEVMK